MIQAAMDRPGRVHTADLQLILSQLKILGEEQPQRKGNTEAAACCLTSHLPTGIYAANVIEGMANRIRQERQRQARSA